MDADDANRALLAVGARGNRRGADAVLADATASRGVLDLERPTAEPSPHHRDLRVALVALVVLVVASALVANGVLPGRAVATRVADDVLDRSGGPHDAQLDEWLAGYDPAERQHLRDTAEPGFGDVTPQYEVGTLEFRRTCRKLAAALEAADAPGVTDRSAAVYEIMGPQLERNDERDRVVALADGSEPLGSGVGAMWEAWHDLTADVAAGDEAQARSFLATNCDDAFGPWIDD